MAGGSCQGYRSGQNPDTDRVPGAGAEPGRHHLPGTRSHPSRGQGDPGGRAPALLPAGRQRPRLRPPLQGRPPTSPRRCPATPGGTPSTPAWSPPSSARSTSRPSWPCPSSSIGTGRRITTNAQDGSRHIPDNGHHFGLLSLQGGVLALRPGLVAVRKLGGDQPRAGVGVRPAGRWVRDRACCCPPSLNGAVSPR